MKLIKLTLLVALLGGMSIPVMADRGPKDFLPGGERVSEMHGKRWDALPQELKDMIVAQREAMKAIHDGMKAAVEAAVTALPEDATQEQKEEAIKAARAAYVEANKDAMAEARAMGEEVRAALKAFRDSTPKPPRPELPEELQAIRDQMTALAGELKAAHDQLKLDLAGKTEEERKAIMEAFKTAQVERRQQMRELRTQFRDGLKASGLVGDRRPDDND